MSRRQCSSAIDLRTLTKLGALHKRERTQRGVHRNFLHWESGGSASVLLPGIGHGKGTVPGRPAAGISMAARTDRPACGHRARSTKFFSTRSPISWLFSGWNCVAKTLSFHTDDAKVSP